LHSIGTRKLLEQVEEEQRILASVSYEDRLEFGARLAVNTLYEGEFV